MIKTSQSVAVFWFRRDLRLHDNHGLFQALSQHERVLPIFIFDREILDVLQDQTDKRVAFIYRTLVGIHERLAKIGGSLRTFYGTPLHAFRELLSEYEVEAVYCNHDYEPYAKQRDGEVAVFLEAQGIPLKTFKDQCIFEKSEIVTQKGTPYTVFTPYYRKWRASLEEWQLASFANDAHFGSFLKVSDPFPFIPLEEMGFKDPGGDFPPAEIAADRLREYERHRDFPAREGTSRLGLHLRFGTISIRETARRAREINENWLRELVWREFFMQILHHFPRVVKHAFREAYDAVQWRNDEADFNRWRQGKTGVPIVDAGMRELNRSGYMHNRVRMIAASFLCKHLLIDWRWGERYFAAKLLDYELASNNGNWQWAAGTGCDAAPYFRVFNPFVQADKFDKDMVYIKQWVPELLTPDYPPPMVDHAFARKRAIRVYKAALDPKSTEEDASQPGLFEN